MKKIYTKLNWGEGGALGRNAPKQKAGSNVDATGGG